MKKHPVVVIKLGTSSIVNEKTHQPLLSNLALIVETCVSLRNDGYKVVLVSSGAIGVSLNKMKMACRPKHLPQVQALAAIGQCRLMAMWEEMFERFDQIIAQVLLTRNDIADRTQYLNAQNTFNALLNMGAIPIVNENDTIAVTEIKFGDNDTLSAITAGMVGADYLFLMTDVDCLYDKNPRCHPDAKPIEVVENVFDLTADVSSKGSALGTGGMGTKIVAARLATAAGVTTIITRSSLPGNVAAIVNYLESINATSRVSSNADTPQDSDSSDSGRSPRRPKVHIQVPPLHTRFLPLHHRMRDRQFWLMNGQTPHGIIHVDRGAARALSEGRGLLPAGVIDAEGIFSQQECVRIFESDRIPQEVPDIQEESGGSIPACQGNPGLSRGLGSPASSLGSFANALDFPDSGPGTPAKSDHGIAPTSSQSLLQLATSLAASMPRHRGSPSTPSSPLLRPCLGPSTPVRAGHGKEIGRALVNYSSIEIKRIAGLQSCEISGVLGYADTEYVAFKENVALLVVHDTKPAEHGSILATEVSKGLAGYVKGLNDHDASDKAIDVHKEKE